MVNNSQNNRTVDDHYWHHCSGGSRFLIGVCRVAQTYHRLLAAVTTGSQQIRGQSLPGLLPYLALSVIALSPLGHSEQQSLFALLKKLCGSCSYSAATPQLLRPRPG